MFQWLVATENHTNSKLCVITAVSKYKHALSEYHKCDYTGPITDSSFEKNKILY